MQLEKAQSLLAVALVAVSLPLAPGLAAADGSAGDQWSDGPVRWLMLPEDMKAYKQARKAGRSAEFVDRFWARRDPSPHEAGNRFRELFERRVAAADALYAEGGVPGSLTDRGGAFILLGSPAHVKVTSEPALAWSSDFGTPERTATRTISVETWGFRLEDLPDGLLEIAGQRKKRGDETLSLTLTFRSDRDRTELVDGATLLNLAARSYIRRPAP